MLKALRAYVKAAVSNFAESGMSNPLAEIVGALYPGKVGSPPAHCRFDPNVVSRVSATFERVRGHVLNCTSDLPRWFRALTQERKEKRKRRREKRKRFAKKS